MLFMWNIDDSPCASKTEFLLRKRYFLDKREVGYNEEKFDILLKHRKFLYEVIERYCRSLYGYRYNMILKVNLLCIICKLECRSFTVFAGN